LNYIIILGSDDVCSTDTIRKLMVEMEKGYDLIGVNSVYFYGADGQHRGELCKLQTNNRILGVGKTISSTVLDKIDWRPWTKDRNWGMDAFVTQSIKPHVKSFKILSDTFIVDVKSRDNLNKMTMWARKIKTREDPQEFYSRISKEEFEILKSI
jgi:hypothetical protein